MIFQSDLHTHSNYSDGKTSVREMALGAEKAGLKVLGLSEHSPLEWQTEWCIKKEKLPEWSAEVDSVRAELGERLTLLRGTELDWCSDIDTGGFDYVIGSTHELFVKPGVHRSVDESEKAMLFTVETFFHGDFYAYTKFYYETLAEWASRPVIDILGHIDIVTKFNEGGKWFDENDARYLRPAEEAVEVLAAAGFIFEMNSGAISRGYRKSPYPSTAVLRMIHAHGGRVMLGSDAHAPADIAFHFKDMAELAQSCGFKTHMCWKNGGFAEEKW